MSRHRGVRNRQFSYDEGEDDYYDDDEEADAACEEYRQSVLHARGEGSGATAGISSGGGGSGSVVSLSSYFGLPDNTSQRQKQQQQQQSRDYTTNKSDSKGMWDTDSAAAAVDAEDAELVAAIAAELEKRLGKGRFAPQQVRQAVVNSEYEVDMAEVILLTTDQAPPGAAPNETHDFRNNVPSPPLGLGAPTSAHRSDPYDGSAAPSSLAFGLKVDGQGDWRQVGGSSSSISSGAAGGSATTTIPPAAPPGFSGLTPSASAAAGGGSSSDVEPFGFDTPSPDDVNFYRQSGAGRNPGGGGGGGSGHTGGIRIETPVKPAGAGVAGAAAGSGRKKATVTSVSSPRAKVVHISTGSTPTTATRKSVLSPTTGRASAQATPMRAVGGGGREVSPTTPKSSMSPMPQAQAAAAEGADESDDGEAGGKERLAMVVIGHVDAGKSTLMGQVCVSQRERKRPCLPFFERNINDVVQALRGMGPPRFVVDKKNPWLIRVSFRLVGSRFP